MIILSRYIFFKYLFFPIFNHYNIFVYYLNYIYLLSDPSYEQILLILNVLIYAYIRFNEPIKQTYICKKCINANINNVWKCVWQKERLRKKEAGVSSSWKHRDQHLITETRPSVRVWDLQHTGHRPQISSDGVWHHQTPWEPQRNERKAHLTCGARQTFSKERKASLNTLNGWNQRLISSASKHARKTHEGPTSLYSYLNRKSPASLVSEVLGLVVSPVSFCQTYTWWRVKHFYTLCNNILRLEEWMCESYPCTSENMMRHESYFPSVSVSVYLMTFWCVNERMTFYKPYLFTEWRFY